MIRVAVEYGIFTNPTREGFDAAYSSNKVKESVMYAAMSSVMITDEAIEKEAQQWASVINNHKFIRRFDKVAIAFGISEEQTDKFWGDIIGNLNKPLDPRLTDKERLFCETLQKIISVAVEKGYFKNTPETAPPHSNWAKRIKAVDQEKGKGSGERGA
jgi:hypothetical protein